jgi:integrase/recombinase XerD
MMLRVEQGKGGKDRHAMLSPPLLELLRDWWRIAQPQVWLFPRLDPINPMPTRQLNCACRATARTVERWPDKPEYPAKVPPQADWAGRLFVPI